LPSLVTEAPLMSRMPFMFTKDGLILSHSLSFVPSNLGDVPENLVRSNLVDVPENVASSKVNWPENVAPSKLDV
jgi:hypothetical protein